MVNLEKESRTRFNESSFIFFRCFQCGLEYFLLMKYSLNTSARTDNLKSNPNDADHAENIAFYARNNKTNYYDKNTYRTWCREFKWCTFEVTEANSIKVNWMVQDWQAAEFYMLQNLLRIWNTFVQSFFIIYCLYCIIHQNPLYRQNKK